MFSLLCFSLSFLNLGLNNLDVVLGSVIKEIIKLTHKVTVSVWIYHAIQSMNWTLFPIAHGNLEQKFKW